MHIDQIIRFITGNADVITTFIVSLIALIKLTTWGKAQAKALDAVVGVIERVGAHQIKTAVAGAETKLPVAAQDALKDSVAKADPKKSPLSIVWKILREVVRGL